MTQMAVEDLAQRVRVLLEQTSFEALVRHVRVEPSDFDDGVFRVFITLEKPESIARPELLDATRTIEDELSILDERFASVRFAEAA